MKLKNGDVFEVHFSENRLCYGQILSTHKKDAYTIVFFEGLYKSRPSVKEILADNILLFGNTFDAKFHHKHWIVFDNEKSNLDEINLPFYKLGTNPIYIEDFSGNSIRKAKADEEDKLYYRSYVAPVRFELAIKAYYKIIEWDSVYDELLYSYIISKSNSVII
ncbi:hypothetical protein IRZ71_20415 [Flavobacterium sp. ANB]|uniref:Imm26 family immunity protein n=1 Tax=unclassified Flavobacterium TaxID=196869 RepID=UPI0012B8C9CF|nr:MULTISPECIES: Imm26 family immunity protein [unclassified Flavobacterium]MBF4518727.1 hypothetical protein [Flavobacterium sp. ANB]MTD67742.1 hypothetical protein [Flavobacterium sp. LC2016-13]